MTAPSPDHKFFLYCPNTGMNFYETEQQRDEAAKIVIDSYLDEDGWDDEVQLICAGVVSHYVTETDRLDRVGELDEEGYDEAGEYWPEDDIDCKCGYALMPASEDPQP